MDLNLGQTAWNNLFQRIGLVTSVYHALDRIRDELKRDDIIVDEFWDPNGYLTNWVLTGIDLFANTDVAGLLYVEISANAANWDVELFTDVPRTVLVSKATNIAAGATGPLVEQNDSGISGTVDLDAGIAADAVIWLRPRVGLLAQISSLPIDDTFDSFLQADLMAILTDVVNGIATAISKSESFTKRYLINWISNKIKSQESSYSNPSESVSGGTVSFENEGILRDFVDAMNDETVPAVQTIEAPAIGSISEAADADNTGAGTVGTPTWFEYAEECLVTLQCIVETIGSELFSVVAKMNKDGSLVTAQNNLTVKKAFLSTDVGVKSMTLTRTIIDAGAQAGAVASWVINGELSTNTDDGELYGRIKDDGGTRQIWIWSSEADRDADDTAAATLVLYGERVGDGVMTLTEQNSLGLSGTVAVTYAAPGVFDVNLQVFKIGDRIYLDYSRTAISDFELFFGRLFKTELPYDNAAAHTIEDDYANRGYAGLGTEI